MDVLRDDVVLELDPVLMLHTLQCVREETVHVTCLLPQYRSQHKVDDLEAGLVDVTEVLLDIHVGDAVDGNLMVQHLMDGQFVHGSIVQCDGGHRVTGCIERQVWDADTLAHLLDTPVERVVKDLDCSIAAVEVEHTALLSGLLAGIFLQKGSQKGMRCDDDSCPVLTAVAHLGTLIGDVAVLVIDAVQQVYGIGAHGHEGDEEGIASHVTLRVDPLLIGNGCNGPHLVDGQGTLLYLLVVSLGKVELQRTLDIDLAFRIVVVGAPCLVEHPLHRYAVVRPLDALLTKPCLIALHQRLGHLVAGE